MRVTTARRVFSDEEMLTRGLQSLAAEMESLEAPAEVEAKLLEAFRARHGGCSDCEAAIECQLLAGGNCSDVVDCDQCRGVSLE